MTAKSRISTVSGAVRMVKKQLHLVILVLLIGCQQADMREGQVSSPTDETVAEADLSKQLKINRDALYKGSTELILARRFRTCASIPTRGGSDFSLSSPDTIADLHL